MYIHVYVVAVFHRHMENNMKIHIKCVTINCKRRGMEESKEGKGGIKLKEERLS